MSKSHDHKHYANLKVGKPKNSEIDIEGEIPVETMEIHQKYILEETRKNFEAPGFRKGKVPENIFLQSVNEMRVWQEAAEIAIEEAYPEIVHHEKIDVFGRPQITITKLALKNPVGFKIHVAVIPHIKLPDYKKIGKNISSQKPEIVGSGEESIKQKIEQSRENREEIIVKIMDESNIELPPVVVEDEAGEIRARLLEELKKSNMNFEDYLKKSNKTAEKYTEEERAFIERDLKNRLILDKIAKLENIEVTDIEIDRNTEYMLQRHKGSDPILMRHYVHNMLVNEKVFQLLENKTIV